MLLENQFISHWDYCRFEC